MEPDQAGGWDVGRLERSGLCAARRSRNRCALRAPQSRGGKGYGPAFNDWLSDNRLYVPSSERTKLFRVMEMLPAIEAWCKTCR